MFAFLVIFFYKVVLFFHFFLWIVLSYTTEFIQVTEMKSYLIVIPIVFDDVLFNSD